MQNTNLEKRFIKLPEVSKRVAKSRSAIYKAISEGKFPKPYKIGDRAVALPYPLVIIVFPPS